MAINRPLVWILAGGAALALGGVAFWLWRRRRARIRGEQLDADTQPSTPVEQPTAARAWFEDEPAASEPVESDERQPAASEPDELELLEVEPDESSSAPVMPERGQFIAPSTLPDGPRGRMVQKIRDVWPTRPQGPELEPMAGDDVAFVVIGPNHDEPIIEVLLGRIHGVTDPGLDVEVTSGFSRFGVKPPTPGHGYAVGDRVGVPREAVITILKPEPATLLIPKTRRKRYRVGAGDLIELRPDTVPELPADSTWQPSRPDVTLRIVEQDDSRSVVALDGPAGEVNIALLAPTKKGQPRTVCSWKFEIVEKAA